MKKTIILLLAMFLLPMMASADSVEIDGIWYNLITKGKVAEVVKGYEFDKYGAAHELYYEGEIVIPETIEVDGVIYVVERIAERAFVGGKNITSVLLNEKIKYIGSDAFAGCINLKKIDLPSSLQTLGDKCFWGSGISELYIPASVNSIGKGIINNCNGLEKVVVDSNNEKYDSRDNCNCIIETSTNYLLDGCKKSIIPSSITIIEDDAFFYCEELESIVIPSSVISIGENCFDHCVNLNKLVFNEGLISVSRYEFSSNSLEEVSFPNSLVSISSYSWYQCNKLKKITFGKNIRSLEIAFIDCKAIEEVYCLNNYPPSLNHTFEGSDVEYATLYVPAESIDLYKKSDWSVFGNILPLSNEERKKCATPNVSYNNGQLRFSSATDGAECVTTISDTDVKTHYGNAISLTATYNISVYATKSGYDNSDVATATLCWIDKEPTTEGITDGVAQIPSKAVLIQSEGGILKVEGIDDGTQVAVYTPDGKQAGSAVSRNGAALVGTSIQPGNTAIVKIGEKTIKVIIR